MRVVYLYAQGWTKSFPPPRLLQGFFSWHSSSSGARGGSDWNITCLTLEDRDGLEPGRLVHSHCGSYVWLQGASDEDVLAVLTSLQPHAIVDLSSYTVLSRPHVVAAAPACFKVNAVNYPSTMGGVFEDLLLTDRVSSPPEASAMYGEKLLMMPGSGFPAFFADGAGELVPMFMRMSLMRHCNDGSRRDDPHFCSSADGDAAIAALLSSPPPPPSSFISLLLNFTRSPSSSVLDKSAFIFASLTSLRAALLATRQFNGTDLFHLAEGRMRLLAHECALPGSSGACLEELMGVVGGFLGSDAVNQWSQSIFSAQSLSSSSSSSTPPPPPPPSSASASPLHVVESALKLLRCNLSREAHLDHKTKFMNPR
jgi:hypothetical protein